jgi:hypothetical protein
MMTRRPRWQQCSRLSPRTGRRLRKKCHSWCRLWRFFPCHVVISLIHISARSIAGCFFPSFFFLSTLLSQTRIYTNTRGTAFGRGGGKSFAPHHQQNDRPLPPSYVCYRCGQKGMYFVTGAALSSACLTLVRGHWIQDCPTNSDREFDNKPRIKRTTGIPRSFLKAVDNPTGARIGQGVMVTPEGGYVVAQPDS